LKQRELDYRAATEEYRRLSSLAIDAALVSHADGKLGLEQARRLQEAANQAYFKALREFTEYVLWKKIPE
jgi:hypothetical protein